MIGIWQTTKNGEIMDSEEETIKVSSATNLDNGVQRNENCKVCQASLPKYTCPRCMVKTCSLQCVKDHKARTGCTGIRDKTAYVPIKEFTERNLLSDYRFLEDADRKCYSANVDELNKPTFQKRKQKIMKECYKRGVTLKLLPHQFSKHRENSTIFVSKTKLLLWHVKWMFVQSDAEFTNKRLRENITLREALKSYLDPSIADPIIRHRLKKYSSDLDDNIMVLLKVENRPSNSVRYHLLNLDRTLRDNLSGKTILEYPTLHVILQKHAVHYTLLEQDEAEPVSNGKKEVHLMPLTPKDEEVVNITVKEQLPTDVVRELQPRDISKEQPPRRNTVPVKQPAINGDNQDVSMEQDRSVDISVDPAIAVIVAETNVNVHASVVTKSDQQQLQNAVQVKQPAMNGDNPEPSLEQDGSVDISVDPDTETVVSVNGDKDACYKEQDVSVHISEDPAREVDVSVDLFRGTDPKQQPVQNIEQDDQPSMNGDQEECSKEHNISLEMRVDPTLSTETDFSVDTQYTTETEQPRKDFVQDKVPRMNKDHKVMSVDLNVDPAFNKTDISVETQGATVRDVDIEKERPAETDASVDPSVVTETEQPRMNRDHEVCSLDQDMSADVSMDRHTATETDVSVNPTDANINSPSVAETYDSVVETPRDTETVDMRKVMSVDGSLEIHTPAEIDVDTSAVTAKKQQPRRSVDTKRPAEADVSVDPTGSTDTDQQPEQKKQKLRMSSDHEVPAVEQGMSVDVSEEPAWPTETVVGENALSAAESEFVGDQAGATVMDHQTRQNNVQEHQPRMNNDHAETDVNTHRTSEVEVSVSPSTATIMNVSVDQARATDSNVGVDSPKAPENDMSLESPSAAETGGCVDKPRATGSDISVDTS